MSDPAAGRFDVAIVGAGPAGSTLAALLAGRGISVAVVDRDGFPRDKLCGEFLSYDALPIVERLGIDLSASPAIDRCRVVARHRTLEFRLPHPARGVSRMRLDDLLLREAVSRGAVAFNGSAAVSASASHVATGTAGFSAAVVVGAWGRWGRFDTQLGRAFVRDRAHRSFGFKRHYHTDRRASAGAIELYSFDRGYLGVNDVEGGITNICGLVHASRLAGHRGRWESFVETLRLEEPGLDRLYASATPAQEAFLSSEPVVFRPRSAVEQGIFMAGDASGVIDPLTGNGMAMAIQSSLLLAPLLLRLLAHPAERAAIESEYRVRHGAAFRPRIRWSRGIAALLARPALLDAALRSIRLPRIGELLLGRTRANRDEVERAAERWFGA